MEQAMETDWTPVPFNLLPGNPFSYSSRSISAISATEAFITGIDLRDKGRCVVCGIDIETTLEHAHIVARVEHATWEEMRDRGFIPRQAKSVVHEARNGVLMCKNHHSSFDNHLFYIRWVHEFKRFCFVNHSQVPGLEEYHGRAININADESRLPFHGSFLIQEMRVRGRWPFRADRPISLPIDWQKWVLAVDDDDDDHNNNEQHGNPDPAERGGNDVATRDILTSAVMGMPPILTPDSGFNHQRLNEDTSISVNAATQQQPQTFTPTNPFANPAELRAMKHSFSQQPNWKAAVVEGETWEGTAEDNITKWRGLVGGSS